MAGIKETVSDFGHLRQVLVEVKKIRSDFRVFSAFDEHLLPAQMIGAAGSINGSAVFAPEISVDLYQSFHKGDFAKAQENHQVISKLMDVYNFGPTFFTAMKEAVHQRWFDAAAGHRAPCDVYPADLSDKVAALLKKYKYERRRPKNEKNHATCSKKLGYPSTDLKELPTSTKTFPDGAQYRVELPSVEGPATLKETLKEIDRLGLTIHRISRGQRHHASNG
ncbi:dihydrodipicolinate synthase family protein [Peribacillus frigoritolerans]|nr:dihydrodipicolinate synthase family protein [Peribacillus frigoritolerans]